MYPSNKKVRVTPIRRPGNWLKPGHDGDFMYSGTTAKLVVNIDPNTGKFPDLLAGLEEKEKAQLASAISKSLDELNPYKREDNFWAAYEVKLDRNIKVLDLSLPFDFLDYLVLKSNKNLVAPSASEKFSKGSYKWCLVDEEEEVQEKRKSSDKKKDAYKFLGKLEGNESRMKDFLMIYGKKAPFDANKDWLVSQLDSIIDSDIDGFLAIATDANFDIKLDIEKALSAKALERKGVKYYLPGGDSIGTLQETIDFLKDPKNSDVLMTIKARTNK